MLPALPHSIGFGTYKVGPVPSSASSSSQPVSDEEGEQIILNAIEVGYRCVFSALLATFLVKRTCSLRRLLIWQIRIATSHTKTTRCVFFLSCRVFDCAQFYGNEKLIGRAIKRSKVDRSELFLISKV
jgi:diketogulonate reductase-like aldo/keto reductase